MTQIFSLSLRTQLRSMCRMFKFARLNALRVCAAALCFIAVSCARLLDYPDRYYPGKPNASDLEGTWVMSADSLNRLRNHNFPRNEIKDHQIILKSEGKCSFRSYWMYISSDHPEQQYIETTGTWKIAAKNTTLFYVPTKQWVLEIDLQESSGRQFEISFYFSAVDEHLILWNYIGDPDRNNYVDFLKTNNI